MLYMFAHKKYYTEDFIALAQGKLTAYSHVLRFSYPSTQKVYESVGAKK
jgi:hypothetical protein